MQKIVVLQTPKSSNVGHLLSHKRIGRMMSDANGLKKGKSCPYIRNKAVARKAFNIAFQTFG
jgi:hypothetical protein